MEILMAAIFIFTFLGVPYGIYFHGRLRERLEFLSPGSYEKVRGITGYWISLRLLDRYIRDNDIRDEKLDELRGKMAKLDRLTLVMFAVAAIMVISCAMYVRHGGSPFIFIG